MADELTPALSFGTAAQEYDRFRPRYPTEAVRFAVGVPAPARVVDLGAGTGILTRAVAELGHPVTPVEPDAGMRARLDAATPGTSARAGSAEAIPLPDGAADAVLAGQAYHWFDRDRAHPEIARVLRTGGAFAPIWNLRDESVRWVAALSEIAGAAAGYRGIRDELPSVSDFGDLFGPVERAEFRHRTTHTGQSLLSLIRTRSYYLTATPAGRHKMERGLRELITDHPDLAGRESFELPYLTLVYRAHRR